jgi:imidazole glycerol-phosphate synthase subunit HisH
MKNTVIIDYGMGNVASVQKVLNFLNIPNIISRKHEDIEDAGFLILPGVGSFRQGMQNLRDYELVDILSNQVVHQKKPIFGICLGMQLFALEGTEPTLCNGLGWIKGRVIKIQDPKLRIPHLGWNNIIVKNDLLHDFKDQDFYFIHSYHLELEDANDLLATVEYGREYTAIIQRENLFATQFHPEKSQHIGLQLMRFFYSHYAEN